MTNKRKQFREDAGYKTNTQTQKITIIQQQVVLTECNRTCAHKKEYSIPD